MTPLFHCTVAGKPVPQGRARIPRFGKPYYPKTSRDFRKMLWAAFYQEKGESELLEIDYPVSVLIEAAGVRANGDLDNMAKGVLDALQDAGVLASDDVGIVRELVVRVVDGAPRTVVTITATEAV